MKEYYSRLKGEDMEIKSPVKGKIGTLASLKDGVFSAGFMGEGVIVTPEDNSIYAPISGRLVTVFPTGHAYGIVAKDGTAVLVHIGVDTVGLDGEGFTQLVKQGKKVKAGAKMAEVDFAAIKGKVPAIDVVVLVTPDSTTKVVKTNKGAVTPSDTILEVA